MSRGFHSRFREFLTASDDAIIGALVQSVSSTGVQSHRSTQIRAWQNQLSTLRTALSAVCDRNTLALDWTLLLEYELPRRQKRPDAVVLALDVIVVIEFKVGSGEYDAGSQWQVEDYCLNLRDFHLVSADRPIVPVLCATEAPLTSTIPRADFENDVFPVQLANRSNLAVVLIDAIERASSGGKPIDVDRWIGSAYQPTLTIVEAAERLYEGHTVREIRHRYASNLDATTTMLSKVIRDAEAMSQRVICFVTGIPGAGKTLTGLDVIHDSATRRRGGASGIFLSGNGPLVKVIREALVRSEQRAGLRRQDGLHRVSTFIQNVHQFLRYHRENPSAIPAERVVVFDEAQRAWDQPQMLKKQNVDSSEAAELLDVMARTRDWSVVIALVGGGQEIFLGEAGLEEWGRAIGARNAWTVVGSREALEGGASVAGHRLFESGLPVDIRFIEEPLAHLSVNMRSFRAVAVTDWVNALLDLNVPNALRAMAALSAFPLFVTRDLELARTWLRARCVTDDQQRSGLVATSEDQRLRAYGLERSSGFRREFPFEKWFLESSADVRSSHALEVAASEFECQGLELDWVGLCWGGDFTPTQNGEWEYRKYRGGGWQRMLGEGERAFAKNRYRVLLTRARRGMVIWIPVGSKTDPTLDPDRFDRMYLHLRASGVPDLREKQFA